LVSVGGDLPGVFAVGQFATGVFALGQEATGVVAIGQVSTGVVAVGQLSRGFIAVGQLALGLAAAGQLAVGVVWCAGIGVSGQGGPGLVYGLLPRLSPPRARRVLAWARREPWDTDTRQRPAWPAWRLALGAGLLAGVAALWWFVVGQVIITDVS
jgi:hypothetical protein